MEFALIVKMKERFGTGQRHQKWNIQLNNRIGTGKKIHQWWLRNLGQQMEYRELRIVVEFVVAFRLERRSNLENDRLEIVENPIKDGETGMLFENFVKSNDS